MSTLRMHLLTPDTTEQYLRERGELERNETARVVELSGGVSNQVLLVERGRGDRFVLKQAREQLRVKDEWKCDIRRIWREIDVLRLCGEILRDASIGRETRISASVPEILFEDRENFCYAMTAAPAEHQTWKHDLLLGRIDFRLGAAAGRMLATLHAETWQNENVAALFGDQSYFDALRIDPYYRTIAAKHPELRDRIEELIDEVVNNRFSLVHGDFSPKNLLCFGNQLLLIDFEVGHFGNPAFDNGFFLAHLVLKAFKAEPLFLRHHSLAASVWTEYRERLQPAITATQWHTLERHTVLNLTGCLLARVDGKSQVDYLSDGQRQRVRSLATILFTEGVDRVHDALGNLTRVVELA